MSYAHPEGTLVVTVLSSYLALPTGSPFVCRSSKLLSHPSAGTGPVGTSVQGEIRYEDQVLVTLPLGLSGA